MTRQTAFVSASVLCATAAVCGVLKAVYVGGLEQTAVLFVTVPVIIGVLAALLPLNIHAIGRAIVLVTMTLVASVLVFQEGAICVFMAAPLFYAFAILGAIAIDLVDAARSGRRALGVVGLPLFTMVFGPPQPNPIQTVDARLWVNASPTEVERRLAAARPDTKRDLPWTLALFPIPEEAHGSGLELGDTRAVWFAGGEGKPGWFVTELTERSDDTLVFETVADRSHVAHWLDRTRDTIRWRPVDGGTEVTWTVTYRNVLHPHWYFGPAEAWAMEDAAEHLLRVHTAPTHPSDVPTTRTEAVL